jgi:AcrR family transcriptional regulator
MRKLGQALGVDAMALYRHVRSKDDLLDGIVEMLVGQTNRSASGHAEQDPDAHHESARHACDGSTVSAWRNSSGRSEPSRPTSSRSSPRPAMPKPCTISRYRWSFSHWRGASLTLE